MTLRVRLAQLPVPPPAALAPTGNVPLAAGCLAVAARVHGAPARVEVVPAAVSDPLGDAALAELLVRDEPELLGFSAYLWNVERTLHVAREARRRSPRTRVLLGGPEVSPDNAWLAQADGWDFAITGEAEPLFAALVARLGAGGDPRGLPGVAVRGEPFARPPPATFALADYPSPWLEGVLEPGPDVSAGLETARGCRSHCTFCSYPRSRNVLRLLAPDAVERLLIALRARGARDVVFLDPTFNHRPDFSALLPAVERANAGRGMALAGEVRAEGLREEHATGLARAGFVHLEIGLQSLHAETLKRIGRGGRPSVVVETARRLRDLGIEVQVDLIAGLPGESPDVLVRGAEALAQAGLSREAQVFLLSILPGTAMRADAAVLGLEFDERPPYHVRRTAGGDLEAWLDAVEQAEDALGRSLDEHPRPHLAQRVAEGPPDVFRVDLDGSQPQAVAAHGARHVALWLRGDDLFAARDRICGFVDARLAVDPHATLDVVLRPNHPFPFDLLSLVRARLDAAPSSYGARALAWRGIDLQRRLVVVLPAGGAFPPDWVRDLGLDVPVYREQTAAEALAQAAALGDTEPRALVVDAPDERSLILLAEQADPDAVSFADRALERRWLRDAARLAGWQR